MRNEANRWRIAVGLGLAVALVVAAGLLSTPASAQSPSTTPAPTVVDFMEFQVGRLDDSTPSAVYAITLAEEMVFSVYAFMRTGDVVPQVTVYGPDGKLFGAGALPAGASDSSVANALVATVPGTYTVVVERLSGTGGDYIMIVQPGYEYLLAWDDFETYDPSLSLCWEPLIGLDSIWTLNNGEMIASVLGPSVTSANSPCGIPALSDVYIQTDLRIANAPAYYSYGLEVFRSDNGVSYYAVLFTSEGTWSVQVHDAQGWTPIQDWTPSPLIRPATSPVTIGLWAHEGTLHVYYDYKLVGRVTDPLRRAQSGAPALAASSGDVQPASVEVRFDNIVITIPRPPVS